MTKRYRPDNDADDVDVDCVAPATNRQKFNDYDLRENETVESFFKRKNRSPPDKSENVKMKDLLDSVELDAIFELPFSKWTDEQQLRLAFCTLKGANKNLSKIFEIEKSCSSKPLTNMYDGCVSNALKKCISESTPCGRRCSRIIRKGGDLKILEANRESMPCTKTYSEFTELINNPWSAKNLASSAAASTSGGNLCDDSIAAETFRKGNRVQITGLVKSPQYNNLVGKVTNPLQDTGRYGVKVVLQSDGNPKKTKVLSLLPQNILMIQHSKKKTQMPTKDSESPAVDGYSIFENKPNKDVLRLQEKNSDLCHLIASSTCLCYYYQRRGIHSCMLINNARFIRNVFTDEEVMKHIFRGTGERSTKTLKSLIIKACHAKRKGREVLDNKFEKVLEYVKLLNNVLNDNVFCHLYSALNENLRTSGPAIFDIQVFEELLQAKRFGIVHRGHIDSKTIDKDKHMKHTVLLVSVRKKEDKRRKPEYVATFQNWWRGSLNWIEFDFELIVSMIIKYDLEGFRFIHKSLNFGMNDFLKGNECNEDQFAQASSGFEGNDNVLVYEDGGASRALGESDDSIDTSSCENESAESICTLQEEEPILYFGLPKSCLMDDDFDPNAVYIT